MTLFKLNIDYSQGYHNEDDPIDTIKKLIRGYKDYSISNGDGCGFVYRIDLENDTLYEELEYQCALPDEVVLELPDVDVDQLPYDKFYDELNRMVKKHKVVA